MTEERFIAVEVWHGTATPAELALFDQSRAGARDDLRALRANFDTSVRALPEGRDRIVARFNLGLLEWDHLHLALALTEALSELEKRDGG